VGTYQQFSTATRNRSAVARPAIAARDLGPPKQIDLRVVQASSTALLAAEQLSKLCVSADIGCPSAGHPSHLAGCNRFVRELRGAHRSLGLYITVSVGQFDSCVGHFTYDAVNELVEHRLHSARQTALSYHPLSTRERNGRNRSPLVMRWLQLRFDFDGRSMGDRLHSKGC